MAEELLTIRGLTVAVEGKQIVNGVDLTVPAAKCTPSWGPTAPARARSPTPHGHPRYQVTGGDVLFKGEDIALKPDERARARPLPRVPVPDGDPRRDDGQLPAPGA